MIETSKDLLYVVLAFSVLWLTIFISWTLYYVIMMLRQTNQLIKNFREKIEKVSQAVEKIREKFDHSSAYLGAIGKAVEKMVEFLGEKKKKSRK
jgi:predicted PurR-regulated permease PerM